MEGSVRSGGVLKKKSSSGCLIIKKKVESRNSGGGWEDLSDTSKEKKRPRLVAGDLGVSDDDELSDVTRRKANDRRLSIGFMGYERREIEDREHERNNVGLDSRRERKRNKFDLLDFDEHDEFNGKRMRDECVDDRIKMVGRRDDESLREFGVGSSHRNVVVDKRRGAYLDGSCSGRSNGGLRNRGFELDENDAEMPGSLLRLKYQERADEPIRLQGKNGVLKVMVNKKKKMDSHSHHKKYDHREVEERESFGLGDVMKKDLSPSLPVYMESKPPDNQALWAGKDKMEVKLEKVKPKLNKGIKIGDTSTSVKVRESESDGTDTALKLAPPGLQASSSSKKMVKKEGAITPLDNVTPVKGKEGKAKRGGSTEKQMLREKIREMLIDSGWSIDYRPRRNRDYLDAVYISPSGTAYWSIIKAYEALKKQLGEDNSKSKMVLDSSSFAPLSEDLINKLTRQTKKKIEEEMKRKRKEDTSAKIAQRSAVRDAAESSETDNDDHDGSPRRKFKKTKVEKPTTGFNSNVIQGRTSKVIGRCTLLVRSSDKAACDGYVPYSGKRTLLGWLIESGTAQLSEKVKYMYRRRNRVMLEGWITKEGIHCGCCSKILTVSKFELHAGSKLRQPFQNIYLESGPSLLQCQIDAWNKQGESVCRDFHTVAVDGDDPDDDTCGICGDGGSLICCDSCPSTFHQICLGIQILPKGDWHCPNCTCKFCGYASGNAAEENDSTADELARCSFCEKRYHKSCSEGNFALPMSSNGASFCGLKCQELYDHLQKILGVKNELEAGFSWSLIQRTDVSDTSHRGFPQRVESNSKLAVALSVMDECFMPIIDRRSGFNMIRNVVYNIGSNFNRLNFSGFYTAILERGDEIVSAASIRLRGTRLAEMPFIGTRGIYRRQGMCRRLLSAIETELRALGVEQLIIPAVSEHMNTWTTVFGFHQLENALKKERKSMNMLVFPWTDMLQKQLLKHSDGMKVSETVTDSSLLPVLVEKSDIDSSTEHDTRLTNQQKEPVASSNGTSTPSESNSDSKAKSGRLNRPLNDTTNSSLEANACTPEAPCLKSVCDSSVETVMAAEANSNHKCLSEVSKDAGPIVIVSDGKVNGEKMASSPTRVPAVGNESSADSDHKDKCDGEALCSKKNDEALEKNVTERMNENCDSARLDASFA